MRRALPYWGPVMLYAGFIFYLSSIPYLHIQPVGGLRLLQFDPDQIILHIFEYSILGFLLLRAMIASPSLSYQEKTLAKVAIIGFLYGITDEIHQYFVPNRTASVFDILADGVGSLLGAYIRRDIWPPLRTLR